MKVLLAGTPNFSIPTFTKIIENFNVVGLIAQPNKPVGRNKIVTDVPTVVLAKFHRIKIFQPDKIFDIYDELKNLDFDILITMAYGQIIPEKILKLAKKGSFNIHASLLPKYRGASPIQYAIANGDKKTGLTFMEMSSKMDAGDIIFQHEINIENDDNLDSVMKKLSLLSAENIVSWLFKIQKDDFSRKKQDEKLVTYAPKILKEDEVIPYDTVEKTINKINSLSSIPGAYTILHSDQEEYRSIKNLRVKIFKAQKEYCKRALIINCKDGDIYATDFQFEGRKRITV